LYGIGSSAGEITADHARSHALGLEDRFIQQRPDITSPVLKRKSRAIQFPSFGAGKSAVLP
jgi:hypothetical protein